MNTGQKIDISIVSPVYRAEYIIDELIRRIEASVSQITPHFEIILVEDGGTDNSWGKIEENCIKNTRIKGVKLSRNFGQHHAITAGLDNVKGEWVVVMDCDLQDQPEEIIRLYNKAKEGYDIILAKRANRQDSFFKKLTSALFYKVFSYLSGVDQDGTIANFGIYHKKVIDAICLMREPMRAFPPMVKWVGFKTEVIDVEHAPRFEGKSTYNWSRLIRLATNIALSYSDKPLRLIIKLGFMISAFSIFSGIYFLIKYLLGEIKVAGFASTIIIISFVSGLTIFIMGIIGLYISKIFDSSKGRPLYIVDQMIDNSNNNKIKNNH